MLSGNKGRMSGKDWPKFHVIIRILVIILALSLLPIFLNSCSTQPVKVYQQKIPDVLLSSCPRPQYTGKTTGDIVNQMLLYNESLKLCNAKLEAARAINTLEDSQ